VTVNRVERAHEQVKYLYDLLVEAQTFDEEMAIQSKIEEAELELLEAEAEEDLLDAEKLAMEMSGAEDEEDYKLAVEEAEKALWEAQDALWYAEEEAG